MFPSIETVVYYIHHLSDEVQPLKKKMAIHAFAFRETVIGLQKVKKKKKPANLLHLNNDIQKCPFAFYLIFT